VANLQSGSLDHGLLARDGNDVGQRNVTAVLSLPGSKTKVSLWLRGGMTRSVNTVVVDAPALPADSRITLRLPPRLVVDAALDGLVVAGREPAPHSRRGPAPAQRDRVCLAQHLGGDPADWRRGELERGPAPSASSSSNGPDEPTDSGAGTAPSRRRYPSGSATLHGEDHDTTPAARRARAHRSACSPLSSPTASSSRASHRLS
jgi:hypothetical protein